MGSHAACPFCGNTDKLNVYPDKAEDDDDRIYAYHIHCEVCGCNGRNTYPIGWCETPEAAWEAWDHRGSVRPQIAFASTMFEKYSIEPHGPSGQYVLHFGRNATFHGLNLCTLYDFDRNGEATRKAIVEALNSNLHLSE